jgi:hypothetical protein
MKLKNKINQDKDKEQKNRNKKNKTNYDRCKKLKEYEIEKKLQFHKLFQIK